MHANVPPPFSSETESFSPPIPPIKIENAFLPRAIIAAYKLFAYLGTIVSRQKENNLQIKCSLGGSHTHNLGFLFKSFPAECKMARTTSS